jgi:hypothetical protein
MAKGRIPHALDMRSYKYGNRPDAERDAVAETLLAEGRRSEAILLFEGRPDHPVLQTERTWAIEEGSAFHLAALRRLGVEITEEDLRRCAAAAEPRGRWMDAQSCYLQLGEEAEIRRIAEHLPEPLRPAPPEEAPEEAP